MDGRYEVFAARQKELLAEIEREREVRRRYLIDEAAYALSTLFTQSGEKTLFPPQGDSEQMLFGFDRQDRASLICRLYEHLSMRDRTPNVEDFLLPEECASYGEHIVYTQNYYTERAYENFARKMDAPTVSYASDFVDACAEVGEGLADLCILPFRDERWGTFHSFSRMPEDYGLTVQAVCTVERTDGETMRLSLCGRGCRIPKKAKEVALELLFSSQNGEDFEDVQRLIELLGGQTVFAEALPDRYTALTSWRVTYRIKQNALAPLLLGRRLLAPESALLGLYEMPLLMHKNN